jgi:hypothetical protein
MFPELLGSFLSVPYRAGPFAFSDLFRLLWNPQIDDSRNQFLDCYSQVDEESIGA